jgi:hypothetical protein
MACSGTALPFTEMFVVPIVTCLAAHYHSALARTEIIFLIKPKLKRVERKKPCGMDTVNDKCCTQTRPASFNVFAYWQKN